MTDLRPDNPTPRTPARSTALVLLAAVTAVLIAACGAEDTTGDRIIAPPPPPQVSSGLFNLAATLQFDGCNSTTVYDSVYEIQITDSTFTMGADWSGQWSPSTLKATGESEHVKETVRFCTITTWSTLQITFTSEDEFFGTIVYRRRLLGDCGTRTPCQTSWTISGVRR